MNRTMLGRRGFLSGSSALVFVVGSASFATACNAAAAKPLPITVHKDPSCGCCSEWAERMKSTGEFLPTLVDQADMASVKASLRVPSDLASCHTTEVAGYVIEGHAPADDILRLLNEKPTGVIGLAAPGMPAGSPGMEMPDGRRDRYDVLAFRADGSATIFSRHG